MMKIRLARLYLFFNILFFIFAFSLNLSARQLPTKLILNSPIKSSIKEKEIQYYEILLEADQTARVEIIQDGIDVSLAAIDPKGDKYIESETPSLLYGDDIIFVTAKEAGKYRVQVMPANPVAKIGRYTITLKEIRQTLPEDHKINDAAKNITILAGEATKLKYNGTIAGKTMALEKWDDVIELSKIKKDKVWAGTALVQKGLIFEQLGEFQKALNVYLKSIEIWKEKANRQWLGSSLNNVGAVNQKIGEYEKSISYFNQAIKLQEDVGNERSIGISLNNIGNSYMFLGDFDKAESFFRRSLIIKRKDQRIRGQRSVAVTLTNLGKALFEKGDRETGINFLEMGLEIRRKVNFRWGEANSLLHLGESLWKIGDKEKAFAHLLDANLISQEIGDRRMQAQSLYLLAVAENERGNLENAINHISKGLDLIEQIRDELIGENSRYVFFSTVQNYYELYIDLIVSRAEKTKRKEDVAFALEISERSRARSLVELLREANVNFKNSFNSKQLEDLRELQNTQNNKFAQRQKLLSEKKDSSKIDAEINELDTKIQNLKIKIRQANPKYANLAEGKKISVGEIQNLLDEKSVLLEYKLGEKRSFLWIITKTKINIYILPERKVIEDKSKEFYDLIIANKRSQVSKLSATSKELGRILLSKISLEISNKRIIIVSEGILQYLPFSALHNPHNEKLLADDNELVVLPSASVLAQIRENQGSSADELQKIVIFADPVFDKDDARIVSKRQKLDNPLQDNLRELELSENLPRLIASRQEAQNISGFLEDNQLIIKTDFEANLSNIVKADLSNYQILHFATHGLLNTEHPELSGLVFSLYDEKGSPQDGFLSLNDIYNLKLSGDLVVLSACQTALGKNIKGEGLIGISRGFLYAGSKRIVASLWKVDDFATAEFMKRFYRNHLQKGMSATKALQRTKIEMKEIPRYSSPYYWSAFTLLGDWR